MKLSSRNTHTYTNNFRVATEVQMNPRKQSRSISIRSRRNQRNCKECNLAWVLLSTVIIFSVLHIPRSEEITAYVTNLRIWSQYSFICWGWLYWAISEIVLLLSVLWQLDIFSAMARAGHKMLVTESSARDQNIASEGGRGDCNFLQHFILQDSSKSSWENDPGCAPRAILKVKQLNIVCAFPLVKSNAVKQN